MRKDQNGFIGAILLIAVVFAVTFVSFKTSNETVSGIVYNTTNDRFISGATCFSVRAGENTYVSEENRSSYCLPPNSPYKELVNRAAADKRIKVVVEANKYFVIKAPWVVQPNVKIKEVEN